MHLFLIYQDKKLLKQLALKDFPRKKTAHILFQSPPEGVITQGGPGYVLELAPLPPAPLRRLAQVKSTPYFCAPPAIPGCTALFAPRKFVQNE